MLRRRGRWGKRFGSGSGEGVEEALAHFFDGGFAIEPIFERDGALPEEHREAIGGAGARGMG